MEDWRKLSELLFIVSRYTPITFSPSLLGSQYGADAVFVGSDWKGTDAWNQYEKEFAEVGCTVVYLDHTDGISSTILRDRLNAGEKAL